MSRPAAPPPVCDGPGRTKQKRESNRWWQAGVQDQEAFRLFLFNTEEKEQWPPGWTWYDFCGEACVLKFISEQMRKVTS